MITIIDECAEDACGKPVQSRGFCQQHYQRRWRDGAFPSRRDGTLFGCCALCERPFGEHETVEWFYGCRA